MQHKHRHRIFCFVASAAAVAVAAALVALGAVGAQAASAAPRVINVDGIITGFTPKTINVAAGEQVSICLKSPDTDHDLTIPTVNNFQVIAPTGAAVCKTLTAPAQAGTHRFICSIPGHEAAGMVGSLVVAAPGAPTASAAPRVINVNGIITAFTPKTINVAAGERVSICLTSPDTDHDLTIPTVNNFQVVAPTGPAVCKTLTAPAQAGTHTFICSIPGHEAAGMVGSLVVAAPGAPAPGAPDAVAPPAAGQAPAGGGPGAGLTSLNPLMLGGGLLIAAMMSALLGYRVAQRD
jgi:uncharacterized cupredoxin-like copper-binding protein